MKLRINTSIIKREDVLLFVGKKHFQLSLPKAPVAREMLDMLTQGVSGEKIQYYIKHHECRHLLALFKDHGLLIAQNEHYAKTSLEKTYDFLSYHMGELTNPFEFRKDLHVGIIGCGGTGANIAMCLASSGIKHFSILDYDIVDITNLNRQFAYDSQDLGNSKTFSLKKKLLRLNPDLSIRTHDQKVVQSQDLTCLASDIDLLVSAIDKPAIKASCCTVEYALRKGIPIILGAVGYDSITAGPLLTTKDAKRHYLSCLSKIFDVETRAVTGSMASTNLLLSAMLANNVTSWFYPFASTELLNTRKTYDPLSFELIEDTYYGGD